ncbi:alpha/beta fold hydrolase [Streptomyces antimycoticus]|uniref:Alpha/beta fold hydrolase n=1 Tax=Streptomyces antimycoticus TaxID=68175 RepID=A0ABD5JNG1_9ACTN|nr:alpha/beta fold hydrolase [Streptomyces sp. DSM 41602]
MKVATAEQLRQLVLPGTADPQTVRNACKDLRHAGLVETVGKTSRLGAGGRPVTRQLWNLTTAGLAAAASELGRPVKEMGGTAREAAKAGAAHALAVTDTIDAIRQLAPLPTPPFRSSGPKSAASGPSGRSGALGGLGDLAGLLRGAGCRRSLHRAQQLLPSDPGVDRRLRHHHRTDSEESMTIPVPGPITDEPSIWTALLGQDLTIRHVQVGEWNTRVLEAGSGEETVVLLHGVGGHLEAYARNIPALAARYRVIAYDYPGHGLTTPAPRPLELPDYVTHLISLLDTLGVERAHLNGESLGGWIAVKTAYAHPERVSRIVLNTPGGALSDPAVRKRIRTLSQGAADDPSDERIRARVSWLMADPASVTQELVDVRRTLYAQPPFAESMRNIMCLQEADVRARNMITDDELAAITEAALVVWTSDDPSGPAAVGLRMAEKLPNGRFELVEGAGHWPQWERHRRFNELVLNFLGQ